MTDIFSHEASNLFLANLQILPVVLDIALLACTFNLIAFVYRVLKGPSLNDRAIGLDAWGTTVMCLIVIYSMKQGTNLYMTSVLVIAILGFIALVAEGKFIQSGNIADNTNISITFDKKIDTEAEAKRIAKQSKKVAAEIYAARKKAQAEQMKNNENKKNENKKNENKK